MDKAVKRFENRSSLTGIVMLGIADMGYGPPKEWFKIGAIIFKVIVRVYYYLI